MESVPRIQASEGMAVITPAPNPTVSMVSPPGGVSLSFSSPQGGRSTRQSRGPPAPAKKPWPRDLLSLGGITVGSLFSRWYTDELYNCEHSNRAERQHYNMCGKLVEYCKYFLPGGSVINKKPVEASAMIVWRQQLNHWGQMLDEKVHQFATSGKMSGKRKRECKPFVAASYKRLTAIDKHEPGVAVRAKPQLPMVVDNASPLVVYTLF